nr:heterodisulfide reductase-related iron-sulfur binding cluster [Candidatus Freyarchaeota archaeon]
MATEKYADEIRFCASCAKMCRHVCTSGTITKSESATPYGRCLLAYYIENGQLEPTKEILDIMYQCTTCGLCQANCLLEYDIPKVVEKLRADLVERGFANENAAKLAKNVEKEHNPYGEPHSERFSKVKAAKKEKEKEKGNPEVVYFVGCTSAYRNPEIAEAVLRILDKAKVNYTILDDEWCCGSPILRTGYRKHAEELMKHNQRAINSLKAKTIITSCAGCYKTLKQDYPEQGFSLDAEILHASEYIQRLIDEKKIKLDKKVKKLVTYHDPCHLGRHSEIYDAPRKLLEQIPGVELVEMEFNRENAHCCGSGAGMEATYPEIANAAGSRRIEEAKETGAKVITTTCPFCKKQLVKVSGNGIEICDITELAAKSLE